ncbi:MAG: oxygen-dependent coproporphyrinogen oxidase [Acidimicrobiia bacterium]
MSTPIDRTSVEARYRDLQDVLCRSLEEIDGGSRFTTDTWERTGGGGGTTRILTGDGPIEKAAVNVSAVWGTPPQQLADGMAAGAKEFFASGLSTIVHPSNPHAPTFHANIRYFETDDAAWFGGGSDLTPYYLYDEDARHFHGVLKETCGRHPVADYPAWKTACDAYFHLRHRGEARGVGGIFFDHLTDDLPAVWAFQQDLGDHLAASYIPILERRIDTPYGAEQIEWHEVRRGRYVEFNLVWDRGTRFGIETDGRTESILASLPPRARWVYDHQPERGSPEAELLEMVRGEPRDW